MQNSGERITVLANLSEILLEYTHLSKEYERTLHNYGLQEAFGLEIMFNHMEIHVLSAIAETPGIAAQDLAARFYRTKSAISHMIKFFVKYKLIIKQENPLNARINNLYITDIGRVAVENHAQHEAKIFQKLLPDYEEFSVEDLETTYKAIQIFMQAFKNSL
ncbi:MAG: MarR family winged helix-turn-helix transcriptional regulator [Clostridiales bacterium]|nr:MarR family winged helix-turn-helix transcriptional regulator [Clostridiales bacterium]